MAQCKYKMREHQVSYDNGLTWTSLEVIKGDLEEYESPDCPDSGSEITKWVDLEGDYICEDNRKYKKQVLYVSYDGGVTWYIYFPTVYQKGEYVGVDESFCNNKFEGHYEVGRFDPLKIVKCNSSSTLSSSETSYYLNNYNLISCKIGDCVTSIGDYAFDGCTRLTSIDIPSGVTSIGKDAFSTCRSLTSIDIPSGVTSIGRGAFAGCSSLTSINIPSGVTSIGNSAFFSCTSLTSCTIGSGVTSIGEYVFYHCTSLTSIVIPNSVTSIGNSAFYNCSGLTSIDIPSGVTSIGYQTFEGCSGLTSVTIGSGVTSIFGEAFRYCSGLTSITVNAVTPPTLGINVFDNTNNCPIYVPCGTLSEYTSDTNWNEYENRLQEMSPCDKQYAWNVVSGYSCSGLTKMTKEQLQVSSDGITWENVIPEQTRPTLPIIEENSIDCSKFYAEYNNGEPSRIVECNNSTLTFNDTGNGSPYTNNSAMTIAIIGDCVTSIGDYALQRCSGLTSINIPSGVTSIGSYTFYYCTSLTSINIPSGVTSIGSFALQSCYSLTSINIPSGVTSIGSFAFYYCNSLTSITVNATTPPTLGSSPFDSTNNCPIYVPSASVEAYKTAWSSYASRIQAIPNS